MNAKKCLRCGEEITPSSPHTTNQKFCSDLCRALWWNEQRSQNVTRGEWAKRRYGPVPTRKLSDVECAWLAALVDGEGTIGIYRSKLQGNRSGCKYIPTVSIVNTNKKLIDRFVELTDCWVTVKKYRKDSPNRDIWVAEIKLRKLREFLPQILPYLIAKKRQAELVMEFLDTLDTAPMRTSTVHPKFDRFYQETRRLNRRGVRAKADAA